MGYSKLSIINEMLLLTGQHTVPNEDDGSQEWTVCSAAYDQGAKYLLQDHDWKFATQIVSLARLADSTDEQFQDAYQRPRDALHLTWVRLSGTLSAPYRIVGNRVLITAGGENVLAKYVAEPDPDNWPPMFVSALQAFVKAGIYSGLKKDPENGRAEEKAAFALADRAKSRTDQEEPKRALFKTKHRTTRLTRRV